MTAAGLRLAPVPDGQRLLIALDIDGTLIYPDESITDAMLEQVRRVDELGHEVMLATGRSWEGTHRILERFALRPEFVVCSNGALIMQQDTAEESGYRREYVETFDPTEVLTAIRPHLPSGSYMVEDATGDRRYTEGMSEWNLENATLVDFDDLVGFPASRVVVTSPSHDEEEFLKIVDEMGLHKVSYSIGWTAWLDIAPEGVSKATAMERVRGLLGIAREKLVAIGDGRNDIDMLEWAAEHGRGVAMGGSPEEVIAAANEVTGSVYEDGAAAILASL